MRSLLSGVAVAFLLATTPGTVADASTASPRPTPSGSPQVSTRAVPPPAPKPTDTGNSPAAPDPHPPRGGLGPLGEPVGGADLLHRHRILPKGAPAPPADLTARSWVLADLDTRSILAARDPHGRYQAASIQKILTTVTLLPHLPGNRVVTVSRSAADTEGSHAGLVAGGHYTIDQIFRGLLLVSGNDCAEALAQAAGGRKHAVTLMTTTARDLGAYDTFVQTPSGLDGWQQLTSAYDMTLFLRAAIRQPRFVAYDRVFTSKLPAQHAQHVGAVSLYNQNVQFLTTVKGALVAKTGFTDAAQHTFAGVIERNGHHYGVVLMRAQRYPDDQWVQATKLVNWGLRLKQGTPEIGHLDPAVRLPGTDAQADKSDPPSASKSSTKSTKKDTSFGPQIIAFVVLLAVGAAVITFRNRRRR